MTKSYKNNNIMDNKLEEIKQQRAIELQNRDNLGTRSPIHVVYDLKEHIVSGHSDYEVMTNLKGIQIEYLYVDEDILDCEVIELKPSEEGMEDPAPVTRFYTDRLISIHLTRKSAIEYMQKQKHNLSDKAYIYTHSEGYAQNIIKNLLDK